MSGGDDKPAARLPVPVGDGSLRRYLTDIRQFPMLAPDEEFTLAKAWRERADKDAAHRLVTSHLRLVAKIAMGYRGYGLPVADLISEGNVGMMQAVRRFEPERGFRLATYALWWIRASIQEYILHTWSLVKIGTTAAQKKLFFNLRRLKSRMKRLDPGDLPPEAAAKIASELGVTPVEVVQMDRRLAGGDQSLNASVRRDGEEGGEWQDWLVDERADQEIRLADEQESARRRKMLQKAMGRLNARERAILVERRLKDDPARLEDLATRFGISRERVRQIEVRAFEKLQASVKADVAAEAAAAARVRKPA
jgi:RNA polymerase sigma-32 factor